MTKTTPEWPQLSIHQQRGRMAIKGIVGFFWLLGIGLGLATIVVLLALATQNPITLPILITAVAVAVGLPSVFMLFSHVRHWFMTRLDQIAKWWIPDPKGSEPKSENIIAPEAIPSPDEADKPVTPLSKSSTPQPIEDKTDERDFMTYLDIKIDDEEAEYPASIPPVLISPKSDKRPLVDQKQDTFVQEDVPHTQCTAV